MEVVAEAEDAALAVRGAAETRPDVVVLDITMPGTSGIAAIEQILEVSPETRVLILTMHDDPAYLRQAIESGATGYMVKSGADTELLAAIRAVHRGQTYIASSLADSSLQHALAERSRDRRHGEGDLLSERERQVLTMVAYGHTYKEIANQLNLSVKTVETYRSRLGEKLGLRSRVDLVRYALEHELLAPEDARR